MQLYVPVCAVLSLLTLKCKQIFIVQQRKLRKIKDFDSYVVKIY